MLTHTHTQGLNGKGIHSFDDDCAVLPKAEALL